MDGLEELYTQVLEVLGEALDEVLDTLEPVDLLQPLECLCFSLDCRSL